MRRVGSPLEGTQENEDKKMKKKFMAVTVAAMMTLGVFNVSAAETDSDFESNMDAATYLEVREEQVQKAYEEGLITDAEYVELLAHIKDVAATESFGNGPQNGAKGDGNATCILGEDTELGIFRSESAGMRTGSGNGLGQQNQDGTGSGNGNKSGNGNGSALGARAGSGNGQRLQNSENCVIEN